jgi:hypothetical protein
MRDRFKRFEAWRSANPSRPYSDFYAEVILPVALGGTTPHPTLGANLVDAPFGVSGGKFAKTLVKQGLQPEHKCVDYGCGTLRIGHQTDIARSYGLEIYRPFSTSATISLGSMRKWERDPGLLDYLDAIKPRLVGLERFCSRFDYDLPELSREASSR